ncbi:hypothetical protein F4781DRAFT_420013 [Annulohypoxylon bovei var. microspora]|nr:hypothetical protein F4781DRAFT_420013 [Annulohypoxylon bovei var. microspora]
MYSGVCLLTACVLVALMYVFDGQPEPQWSSNLQYGTVIIAIMSCFRLALKAVSGFRKGSVEAKIEDFKMFDEAATGLWGSLVLIWRMRGKHLACVGAAIMILAQGFETFSSGMVGFDQSPTPVVDKTSMNILSAPPPPRAETWSNIVSSGNTSLGLSAKAAIYDGIIAKTISPIPVSCSTLDCTWPPFPTLAVCGNCTESLVKTSCNSQNGLNVTMKNGIQTSTVISNWSKTNFSTAASARSDEFTFVDIPPDLHVQNQTRYSVPAGSVQALKTFIDSLMTGSASGPIGAVKYSSDWIEALWNATPDLDAWIARLALSMTNEIRRTGTLATDTDPDTDTDRMLAYAGTAYIAASHVRVNWYWVIYPLSLMVLAFCYLAQTVWRTARDRVCAWKGDSLPMLFCHVEPGVYAQVQDGMDVPEGLIGKVGKTEIELVQQDDGMWVFREPVNN